MAVDRRLFNGNNARFSRFGAQEPQKDGLAYLHGLRATSGPTAPWYGEAVGIFLGRDTAASLLKLSIDVTLCL